jgi:hypothetical protein
MALNCAELMGDKAQGFSRYLNKIGLYDDGEKLKDGASAIQKTYGLSDDELFAINLYTGGAYIPVNRVLFSGAVSKEPYVRYISVLVSGLKKLPEYQGTVYRSTHELPVSVLEKHHVGATVTYEAFTSATYADYPMYMSGKHTFEIHGLTGRKILELSRTNEPEVVFLPGTKFRVLSRSNGGAENAYHFVLEEIRP